MKKLLSILITTTLLFTMPTFANDHLIVQTSPYSVSETADRFVNLINDKGLTLFTRIDHSANAQKAGLELTPTEVILFGNPKAGTPLMQCAPTMAIDLPQKVLVWQNAEGDTQFAYPNPAFMKELHNIESCDPVLEKISGLLASLAAQTTSK